MFSLKHECFISTVHKQILYTEYSAPYTPTLFVQY